MAGIFGSYSGTFHISISLEMIAHLCDTARRPVKKSLRTSILSENSSASRFPTNYVYSIKLPQLPQTIGRLLLLVDGGVCFPHLLMRGKMILRESLRTATSTRTI